MAEQWPQQWFLDSRMHQVEALKTAIAKVQAALGNQQSRLEAFRAEEGLLDEPHEVEERERAIAQCESEIQVLQRQLEGIRRGLEQEKRVVGQLLLRKQKWQEEQQQDS